VPLAGDEGQVVDDPVKLRRQLTALRSASDWEGAHDLLWWSLREMPAITQPIHCNIVLASLSESSQWQLALVLLEHMASAGIERDGYSFSAAICACARANEPERAVEAFKAMCAADLPPSSVAFNSAIAAAQRSLSRTRAAELVLAIYTLETFKLRPDAWASAAAICALSDLGEHARARALFRSLRAPDEVSAHTVAAALRAAARVGDWAGSIELYAESSARGVTPTPHTLNAVLGACVADVSTGWRTAVRLLAEAPSGAADMHCFTTAIRACAASGRWREATRLLREMERRRVPRSAHTYSAAIQAHRKEARHEEAIALFEEMASAQPGSVSRRTDEQGWALRIPRREGPASGGKGSMAGRMGGNEVPAADSHCASAVLEVCASAGAWSEAVALVESLRSRGIAVGSRHVRPALASCTRAGRAGEGLALLRRLRWSPSRGRDDDGTQRGAAASFRLGKPAVTAALAACAKVGDAEMTTALLQELAALGEPLDARTRCSAIAAYGRAGQWIDATRLLEPPSGDGGRPGERGGANTEVDTACYNAALGALRRAGQWPLSATLLARMEAGEAPPPDDVTWRIMGRNVGVHMGMQRGASITNGTSAAVARDSSNGHGSSPA
jgi:pentatricopeptide repeat protein